MIVRPAGARTRFQGDLVSGLELLDLVRYLVLAAIWIFAGRSLLVALGQTELGTTGWLLCPSMTQAFVGVALGMSAAVGWPISRVAIWVWLAVTVLAGFGIGRELRVGKSNGQTLPAAISDGALMVGIAVIVPAIVLLPYLVWGFGGFEATDHPDAWSYTVFSAYLWEFPRLTQGGLAPVYQWASNLSGTRFVGAVRARLARHGDGRTGHSGGARSPAHAQRVHDRKHVRRCRTRLGIVE